MGKGSLCLDNGPVRKISFIATHSLESRTKIASLLMSGSMQAMGLSAEVLEGVAIWEKGGTPSSTIKMNEANCGQRISQS